MLSQLSLVRVQDPPWNRLDQLPDRTIGQSREWLQFVAETQNAEPVVAEVRHQEQVVGWFTGLIARKFGLRILGSPFPGWTTSYMGFNLTPGVDRIEVVRALIQYARRDLGCFHVELMDRGLDLEAVGREGFSHRVFRGYEIDLSLEEDRLFKGMSSACRRCIRKADKEGVVVESAEAAGFADEYYRQLRDVFAKQSLVPTYPESRVHSLIRHVYPTGRLLLVQARDSQGRYLASGIFPAMNGTMYFWGGASYRQYQLLRPNEAIQWFAMRFWKERGITRYDMGGGGAYKRKYGGREIAVPWVRWSRYRFLSVLRELGRLSFAARQRLSGLKTTHEQS